MYEKQIKDLKLKKKDVLENFEILDSNLKRGAISAAEYFKEYDEQKALLTKIKSKIKELEYKKEQGLEPIKEKDHITGFEDIIEDGEEEKKVSLKDKIKSYIPKGLKLKSGASSSISDEEREINKVLEGKSSFDSVTLRKFKFFHEKKIEVDEHPNFLHLTLRSFLEDLGYKIIKMKKPLAEIMEINQEKSRINEYSGYLVGIKKSSLTDSNETLSIFFRHEGICSIFFDGKRLITQTKTQISIAGNSKSIDDGELEKDVKTIFEKTNSFT